MNGAGSSGWLGGDCEGGWADRTANGSGRGLADVIGVRTFRPLSSTVRQPVEAF
jgi:hypothetical protein